MALRPEEYRRRLRVAAGRSGRNSGTCVSCGKQAGWRSMNNRCRSCEMETVKERPPMHIDREVLMAASRDSQR